MKTARSCTFTAGTLALALAFSSSATVRAQGTPPALDFGRYTERLLEVPSSRA
jgi:hypothetical protein